ncbi:26168_t:CDS:2, partial [Racocetra persica]
IAIYLEINRDGWWTCDDLVNQVVECAIPIFERIHLNKIALFMFDNSSNYGSFADDALLVLQIDMKDGTKKLLLRDDIMPDSSKHIMTYINNANVKRPKGIKQVLEERAADFAVKKYCSYHRISEQVLEEFAYY